MKSIHVIKNKLITKNLSIYFWQKRIIYSAEEINLGKMIQLRIKLFYNFEKSVNLKFFYWSLSDELGYLLT